MFEYGWLHSLLISFDVYICQHYVSHFLTTLSGLSPSFSTKFTKAKVPHLREILDALVSPLTPMKLGVYGFVLTDQGLRVGHGKFNHGNVVKRKQIHG